MANSHPDSSLSRECDFGRGGDPGIPPWAKKISTVVYGEAGYVSSLEEMGDKPLRKGNSVFLPHCSGERCHGVLLRKGSMYSPI